MFLNYLTSALRNLAANRLYAAITIVGLAAWLVALYHHVADKGDLLAAGRVRFEELPEDRDAFIEAAAAQFELRDGEQELRIVEDVIAGGDRVVVRGTNACEQESFFGVPGRGIRQTFAAIFIHRVVDGRTTKAHGSMEMPVWGDAFKWRQGLDEEAIKTRIEAIVRYIQSIQEGAGH